MNKLLIGVAIGAAALLPAGQAQAATTNINIYGASAQYLYWNDVASEFCEENGWTFVSKAKSSDDKHGITKCTKGADTLYIRYSSKASYDGIYAVRGPGSGVNTDSCPDDGQRKMCSNDGCTATACQDVTIGASDVAGNSFKQSSTGAKYGPLGGGEGGRSFTGVSTSGVTSKNPLIVPFGFFVHDNVTVSKCLGPDPTEPTATGTKTISRWGNYCYDPDGTTKSADCIGFYECSGSPKVCQGGVNAGSSCTTQADCPDVSLADTSCQRVPLDNISRLQAAMIFSGQVANWQQFGLWYPDLPLVACLRHAGSGTQATIDWAVIRGTANDWAPANGLVPGEEPGWIYFNDGSSDMMRCINGYKDTCNTTTGKCKLFTSTACTSDAQCTASWDPISEGVGTIGFADADQIEGGGTSNWPNVHPVKYNGVEPSRAAIRNGEYDFWSVQWMYYKANDPNIATINQLMSFASNPENLPASKAGFWATADEMKFMKSDDGSYPNWQGAGVELAP